MYKIQMRISWDPEKAKVNDRKHGIKFADVEEVFADPYAITIEDPDSAGERRFVITGVDSLLRLIVAVYTFRPQNVRLISARKATKPEVAEYERRIRFQ